MSKHFTLMKDIKALSETEDFEPAGKHKGDMMKALVHAADLGNPTRPPATFHIWTMKVHTEFFRQGDTEKSLGLEISNLCDRNAVNIAKSQVGYLNFVIEPYYKTLSAIFPKMEYTLDEIDGNREYWKEKGDEYEKLKEEGNSELQ